MPRQSRSSDPGLRRPGRELLLLGAALASTLAFAFASRDLSDRFGLDCRDYASLDWRAPSFQTWVERELSSPLFAQRPRSTVQPFSTECQGTLLIRQSDMYVFALASHNRSELLVDDQPVVTTPGDSLWRDVRGVPLEAGERRLRFRYVFPGGADEPELVMARAGRALRPPNPADLSRRLVPAAVRPLRALALATPVILPLLWTVLVAYRLRAPLGRACHRLGPPLARWHRSVAGDPRRALAVVMSVAVAARLAMSWVTSPILWPDSIQYYETALAYLRGEFLSHNLLSTPLFPLFMAAFLAVKNAPIAGAAMIAVQRLLAVGATALVYRLAREAFDEVTAVYAALIWTVSAVQLYYETAVSTEALFVVLLMCMLAATPALLRRASMRTSASVALLCVFATMTRPVAKGFVIVVLGVLWWRAWPQRRRLIAPSIALLGIFLLGIAPWMYVNRLEYGFWGLNGGEGQWLFLRAIDIDELEPPPETRYPEVREIFDNLRPAYPYLQYAVRDELNYARGYSASQADDAMRGFALETVRSHPFRFLSGTAKQWMLLMINPYRSVNICEAPDGPTLCSERGRDLSFRAFPNQPPAGRAAVKAVVAGYIRIAYWVIPVLAPLAVIGMLRSLRRRDERGNLQVLLAATVLYLTMLTALFNTVQDRFRLPVDALIVMFAIHELRAVAMKTTTRDAAQTVTATPVAARSGAARRGS